MTVSPSHVPPQQLDFSGLQVYFGQDQVGEQQVDIITFKGRIDNDNCVNLNRKIHALLSGLQQATILDFTQLQYTNSTGIAILFSMFHRQKEKNGKLLIGGIHPFTKEILDLVHLPLELPVADTIEDAKNILASM